MARIRKESEQVLIATETTSNEFPILGSSVISLEGPIAGNWVVQSSRKNATPRVWSNVFEVGDRLTAAIPLAEVQGSPTRVYQITGGTAGVTGWVDDIITVPWQ